MARSLAVWRWPRKMAASICAGLRACLPLRCRLCWIVTGAVFAAILAIEAAILMPSYINYERDRLQAIAETGYALVDTALTDVPADRSTLAQRLDQIMRADVLVGARLQLMQEGRPPITRGEAIETDPDGADELRARRAALGGDRMEVRYPEGMFDLPYSVQLRLDTSDVDGELAAFVARIAGLTLVIAAFLTIVTMAVLNVLVLQPVVRLEQQMAAAANAPDQPQAFRINMGRRDELGALGRAFDRLLGIIQADRDALAEREENLRRFNAELDARVAERTQELEAAKARLEREVRERREAEERARSLARFPEENTNPVLRADRDGHILYANTPGKRIFPEADGDDPRLPWRYRDLVVSSLAAGATHTHEIQRGDCWYMLNIVPIADGPYANIYGSDITERKQYEQALQHRAYHDPLTDIPNRALFIDRLTQVATARASDGGRAAAILLGLDDFQSINGTAGHEAGDAMLRLIAERLGGAISADQTVARIGGDVFAVLVPELPATEDEAVATLADKASSLIRAVDQAAEINGQSLRCGASAGIARYPEDAGDAEGLLKDADLAMFRAKRGGGGGVEFFVPELNERVEQRQATAQGLRRALSDGELRLHYQPQLTPGGRLVGAEALMRWEVPGEGLISPGAFIPIAEETGQIVAMGDWALAEACRQAAAWRARGLSLRVAVNLAAPHLRDSGLVGRVEALLAEHALPAGALEVEITESAIMADMTRAIETLTALARLGVPVALDDFGTGYSSLAYLKGLPVHRLKIDRTFIRPLPDAGQDAALCRTILALGQHLGLTVVAEGVEDEEQRRWLAEAGCDELQGFLFSKAMPAEEFAAWAGTRAASAAQTQKLA